MNKDQIPNALMVKIYEVHTLLGEYIKIHDTIFKPSIRKAIPIPGIFKPIDYRSHYKGLNSLQEALGGIITGLNEKDELQSTLKQYAEALLDTIMLLREMCIRLYKKSQGDMDSYSSQQYKEDLSTYQESAKRYKEIGLRLNEFVHRP